ncbi:MAG: hypothetical protein GC154_21680 [bacterium]|nr:hypothetical protein [bacterium]
MTPLLKTYSRFIYAWVLLCLFCGGAFALLAYHPQWILWVETYQPGASYQRAKTLIDEGDLQGAIEAYQRGIRFFKQVYEESHLDRTRAFVCQGYLGLGHIEKNIMNPPDWSSAEQAYRDAIEWYPQWKGAQPYLSLGETLIALGRGEEALQYLDVAVQQGAAIIVMEALYVRGGVRLDSPLTIDRGIDDWYHYLRYTPRDIAADRLQSMKTTLAALGDESLPRLNYVFGVVNRLLGNDAEARRLLALYLSQNPDDPSAIFYATGVSNQLIQSNDESGLTRFYPEPSPDEKYFIRENFVDVYSPNGGEVQIQLRVSSNAEPMEWPSLNLYNNMEDVDSIPLLTTQSSSINVNAPLQPGRNIIRLSLDWPGETPADPAFMLESFHLSPQNQN